MRENPLPKNIAGLALAITMCVASVVSADVRLPGVFGDRMVLQRDKPVEVWGWADADDRYEYRLRGRYLGYQRSREG